MKIQVLVLVQRMGLFVLNSPVENSFGTVLTELNEKAGSNKYY